MGLCPGYKIKSLFRVCQRLIQIFSLKNQINMQRRKFINLMPVIGIAGSVVLLTAMRSGVVEKVNTETREYRVSVLSRISYPE